MPKDNRNTLAAFDDLLASLEGLADDTKDTTNKDAPSSAAEVGPSVDNEFYDFYFEINNVPRKSSGASSTTNSIPPPPHLAPLAPPVVDKPPHVSDSTSSDHSQVPVYPPPPPAPSANKNHSGMQMESPPPKSQSKPPSKPNPNRSNLSLKKAAAKPKGSALRVHPPTGTPAVPYEAPQRFLSRGSYNTGASQVDTASPPPPKVIPPQRFMSTGSYIAPPPTAPSALPPQQPFVPPSIPPVIPAKDAPQRFYSTNNFISRPQPSSPTNRDTPQRFMSTNAYTPNRNISYDSELPARNSYIGNRPSRNSPVPQSSRQATPEPFTPPYIPPVQPYVPPVQPYVPPAQPYIPPAQPYIPPAQPYIPPIPHNPTPHPPQHTPPQSHTQSYYPQPHVPPSPALDSASDIERRSSGRLSSVNSRKSVRMPKSTLPKASNNICAKCGASIDGEHVMALNNFWCLDHFTCSDCGTQLHGVFSEENGRPYCSDCMSNKYSCVTCGRGVTSGQFFQTERGRMHAECMPTVLCDVCNRPIRAGTSKMKALNKVFHPECFRCMNCARLIQGEFTNRSGKPLCIQCSQSNQPKCAKCFLPITGQYVAYSTMRYHHDCFCCARCSTQLSLDAFYTHSDQNYCERCITAILR